MISVKAILSKLTILLSRMIVGEDVNEEEGVINDEGYQSTLSFQHTRQYYIWMSHFQVC